MPGACASILVRSVKRSRQRRRCTEISPSAFYRSVSLDSSLRILCAYVSLRHTASELGQSSEFLHSLQACSRRSRMECRRRRSDRRQTSAAMPSPPRLSSNVPGHIGTAVELILTLWITRDTLVGLLNPRTEGARKESRRRLCGSCHRMASASDAQTRYKAL